MAKDIQKAREARRRWYYKNRTHARNKIKDRLRELKEWWQKYKEGFKCSKCPENHPACIEFHHKSDDKEINVSHAVMSGWSKERILEEVAKCDILCANCHRKEHWSAKDGRLVFRRSVAPGSAASLQN